MFNVCNKSFPTSSLVAYHGSPALTTLPVHVMNVLDQLWYHERVLKMFNSGGLIRESVAVVADKMDRAFVFVVQSLVWDGNEESMAYVFFVPSVITQFSYVESLVEEKAFQVQNETEIVLYHLHV